MIQGLSAGRELTQPTTHSFGHLYMSLLVGTWRWCGRGSDRPEDDARVVATAEADLRGMQWP